MRNLQQGLIQGVSLWIWWLATLPHEFFDKTTNLAGQLLMQLPFCGIHDEEFFVICVNIIICSCVYHITCTLNNIVLSFLLLHDNTQL